MQVKLLFLLSKSKSSHHLPSTRSLTCLCVLCYKLGQFKCNLLYICNWKMKKKFFFLFFYFSFLIYILPFFRLIFIQIVVTFHFYTNELYSLFSIQNWVTFIHFYSHYYCYFQVAFLTLSILLLPLLLSSIQPMDQRLIHFTKLLLWTLCICPFYFLYFLFFFFWGFITRSKLSNNEDSFISPHAVTLSDACRWEKFK